MSDVNANISVSIDTSAALSELKNLQRQISQFHGQIAKSSASAAIAQRNLQQEFLNSINATGQFAARMQTIKTSAESFTTALEKNKFSMREYFRYGIASSKSFGQVFKTEFETINKVAEERVRKLQTQYIKMGRDATGAMKAIAVTPLALDMENLGTKTMIAAQRQQLFNQLLAQGTTNLVNFGKNTQWAGRQLMVGFTVPLSIFGTTASKVFMDIEKQAIRFKRVYGDIFTLPSETQANLEVVKGLAQEFTKYGVAIADTMSVAADAAAAGFQGQKLAEQVKAATRLSVLGEVDKQQALQATISIQSAFKMNSDQLAESINFLNAVENQSVVSLQNLTDAIPKVAPVIRGLGGDIKDMSVFLAAMQEGGVNASEAANGLKSALASMINPTKAARTMLKGVGIDLNTIVSRNEGNLMRTVLDLADAMKTLTPLARQRILEQLFGKFQFARVSALFDNIARSGSQASQALELVKMSSQDLAAIANKELNAIQENSMTKFKAAVESLRSSIAPVGEAFLKVVTPVIEFFTKMADKFNNLSDGSKKVVTTLIALFAGVGPIVLMLVGLIANFGGQMLKLFGLIRNGYLKLTGQSKYLGEQTQYLTSEQMQAEAVAHSLDQVHARLTQRFTIEASAVDNLKSAYLGATAAAERFAFNNPGMMLPGFSQSKRFATGGIVSGPGTGTSDSIPAMLSNGEAVIPAKNVQRYPRLTAGLVAGNIPGFAGGLFPTIGTVLGGTFRSRQYSPVAMMAPGNTPGGFGMDKEWLAMNEEAKASFAASIKTAMMMEQDIKVTQVNYRKFGQELTPTIDQLFEIFKQGITKDVTNVSEVGQTQYPLIIKSIEEMAASGQIAASDMQSLSNAVRKLLSPLQSDLTQQNLQRVELATNDLGETFVKRASTERYGTSYKDQIRRSFVSELQMRGMESPQGYPSSYQFAHIPYSAPTQTYVEPFLRKKAGAGSAMEQQVLQELRNGAIFKEGQVIVAKQAEKIGSVAISAMASGAGTASPSEYTNQIGQDVDNGLIIGMQQNAPLVKATAERVANQAIIGMRNTGLLDKNGKPIFVSETGSQPTSNAGSNVVDLGMPSFPKKTLSQRLSGAYNNFKTQSLRGKAQAISGGAMKYGMVASGAVMAASMMPGPVGQLAQAAAPAVMGLQSLAMALPMLTNPIGATVAGIAAVAAGFMWLRKKQEEHIKALEDQGRREAEARFGSINSINAYSKYIGDKALPSERQFNRVGDQRFISADLAKLANFRNYYNTAGKEDAARLTSRVGKSNAAEIAAKDVATRAATFGLGPADIAANIKAAAELAGVSEVKLKGNVQELLVGKNGPDITKEPLSIDAKINYLSKSSQDGLSVIQRKIGQIVPATMPTMAGGYAAATAMAIQQQKAQETQIKNTKFATVSLSLAMEDQKNALAVLNAQYVDGKISVDQYNAAYAAQMTNFENIKKVTDDLVVSLDKFDPTGKASAAAISDLADQAFSSLEKTNKKLAAMLKKTVTTSIPKNMRTNIMLAYAQGSLQPQDILQIDALLKEMDGKTVQQKMKFVADLTGISEAVRLNMELAVAQQDAIDKTILAAKHHVQGAKKLNAYEIAAAKARGEVNRLTKAIEDSGKATKDSPTPDGKTGIDTTGTQTNPYAFVDDLLSKWKQVKNATIDATKGVNGFIAAMKGSMNGFNGTNEILRANGATQGFIDIVNGLDAKTLKTIQKRLWTIGKDGKLVFGDLGKALQQYTKNIDLGTFVNQQQIVYNNSKDQITAYTKLASSGLSASKIMEILGDNAATAAVASEKVGSTNWNKFIAGAKQADANVKQIAQNMKILQFQDAQSKETPADVMNQYFAAQEAIIKLNSRNQFKATYGMSPEAYQQQIESQQLIADSLQAEVDKEQKKIDLIQEENGLYNRGLDLIGRQEDVINKAYDERQKALDTQITALEDVKKINQQLIDQQKQQTDLAGALSSGDISAAARIAQEMRAASSQNSQQALIDNLGKQKNALDLQKEKDLAAIQVDINGKKFTRIQLQDMILKNEDLIYGIEQGSLKTAQDNLNKQQDYIKNMQTIIDKYNRDMTNAIANVTNKTGKTKAEWDTVQTAVETVTEWLGDAHMLGIMDDVAAGVLSIEAAWQKVIAAIKEANALAASGSTGATNATTGWVDPAKHPELTTFTTTQQSIIDTAASSAAKAAAAGNVMGAGGSEAIAVQAMKDLAAAQKVDANTGIAGTQLGSAQVVMARKQILGYLSSGGLVPKYFAVGGFAARGSDTVPAMLTPGEFVMNRYAVQSHGIDKMRAINSGESLGNSLYNYSITVNAKSDANADDIARSVMTQIKQIDAQKLRGVRK